MSRLGAIGRTVEAWRLVRHAHRAIVGGAATDAVLRRLAPVGEASAPVGSGLADGGRVLAVAQLDAAVRRAAPFVRGALCVPQSIALAALATRRGIGAEVVLGSRRTLDGTWAAHAWVRAERTEWLTDPGERFRPLATYRSAEAWRLTPIGSDG